MKSYSELFSELVEEYKKYNKYNKLRLVKKHCNMATAKAIKVFPRMRKMECGKKVFTYKIENGIYFTCIPNQEGCSNYTLYKVLLVLEQQGNRNLF